MIALRRAEERHYDRSEEQEVWRTFRPEDGPDSFTDRFGPLAFFDEGRLAPGGRIPRHPVRDGELLTYVREGSLSHDDSLGGLGVVHAGDFQRITAVRGTRLTAANASTSGPAHVFQIGLRPSTAKLAPAHEQKHFRPAERRGALRLVASPDGRGGSLHVRQDAFLYSAMLNSGQQVTHPLARGRRAWLHLVHGRATLGELVLATGDGLGVSGECAISLIAREATELLLLDLPDSSAPARAAARPEAPASAGSGFAPGRPADGPPLPRDERGGIPADRAASPEPSSWVAPRRRQQIAPSASQSSARLRPPHGYPPPRRAPPGSPGKTDRG